MKRLLPLLLTGCMTVTTQMDWARAPEPDWPVLQVRVEEVTQAQIANYCSRATYAAGLTQLGCSTVNFPTNSCTIYVLSRDKTLIEHETGHCRGYDHPGESTMHDAWRQWKK